MSHIHQDASQRAADIMARILSRRRAEQEAAPAGEIESIPECRVLYRNGAPTEETITERKRISTAWQITRCPPTALPNVPIAYVPRKARGKRQVDMATVLRMDAEGIGIKRIAKAVRAAEMTVRLRLAEYMAAHPEYRRAPRLVGKRPAAVTATQIYALQDEGMENQEIAARLGVTVDQVAHTLCRYRKSSREAAEEDRRRRTCPQCGKSKLPRLATCARCRETQPGRPHRKAKRNTDSYAQEHTGSLGGVSVMGDSL